MTPKVLITTDLSDDSLETLQRLKGSPLLDDKEIHIIHVLETINYKSYKSSINYPRGDEKAQIEEVVMDILLAIKNRITPIAHKYETVLKCLFEPEAKESVIKYAKEISAEFLVIATRGKKGIPGLFRSSFSQYMCQYAPCDLMILRPLFSTN